MATRKSADKASDRRGKRPEQHPNKPLSDKDVIFARQLAEVYLLIDNVTNFSNKEIPAAPKSNDQFYAAFGDRNWLKTICNIPWPPHFEPNHTDEMAAQLVIARDLLNNAAEPANGLTIAFTQAIMNVRKERNLIGIILEWLKFWKKPSEIDDSFSNLTRDKMHTLVSQDLFSEIAYPTMRFEAKIFIGRVKLLFIFMFVFSLLTFSLSWVAATGSALLTNDLEARAAFLSAGNSILNAEQGGVVQDGSNNPPPIAPTNGTALTTSNQAVNGGIYGYDPERYCLAPSGQNTIVNSSNGKSTAPDPDLQLVTHHKLCGEYARQRARVETAQHDLKLWNVGQSKASSYFLIPWLASLTGWDWQLLQKRTPYDDTAVDAQWAAAWLHVIGGIVLPIFYGVLGAGAAAGRMLSSKMRDSTLTPRDGVLAIVNVGLGSLIGGCIGLFITPADVVATPALSHLSTSALCFLAGFAIDGVFKMLERMSDAVFNNEKQQPAKRT